MKPPTAKSTALAGSGNIVCFLRSMNSSGAVSYVFVASAPFRGAKPSAALPRPSARTAPAGFRNRAKVLCPALIFRTETEKKRSSNIYIYIYIYVHALICLFIYLLTYYLLYSFACVDICVYIYMYNCLFLIHFIVCLYYTVHTHSETNTHTHTHTSACLCVSVHGIFEIIDLIGIGKTIYVFDHGTPDFGSGLFSLPSQTCVEKTASAD